MTVLIGGFPAQFFGLIKFVQRIGCFCAHQQSRVTAIVKFQRKGLESLSS